MGMSAGYADVYNLNRARLGGDTMSTNFYWANAPTCKKDTQEYHIGKRCAAGVYCWDCGVSLVHDEQVLDQCPSCQKERPDFSWDSAMGVELGFSDINNVNTSGVGTCFKFIFTNKEYHMSKIKENASKDKKIIVDEYGREYTAAEFLKMLKLCPLQEEIEGEWF